MENNTKKIDYQFVPVPHSLVYGLDKDCLKAICIMIDKENYWECRNKVFNGYFTLSVEELGEYLGNKNKKDTRLTLEALYRAGIIDLKVESGKRLGAKVKLNWEKIKSGDFDYVEKLPRNSQITYITDTECTSTSTKESTYCTPTLDIDRIDKEIDTDIEKDIEKDKEQNITPFEGYLISFIEKYPSIDYSYSMDRFISTYSNQLLDFQTYIEKDTGLIVSIEELGTYLYYYKTQGIILP